MRVKGIKHDAAEAVNPLIGLLVEGRLHDPFGCLGLHREHDRWTVRSLDPHAEELQILMPSGPEPMKRVHPDGVFEWHGAEPPTGPWTIVARAGDSRREYRDPWAFLPEISAHDLYLFNEGRLQQAWRTLGPHAQERHGVAGVRFACWAPNAERVSVVGEFNRWDGRCHPMASRGESGVWELFVPGLAPGALYRFEIRHRASGEVFLKTDPYAREFELRPGTAARVPAEPRHAWADDAWMARRAGLDWLHAPLSVYEVHLGSWQRGPEGRLLDYREIAERMVPYVLEMGFTHVELLPVSEHPLDESWGYQTTGYFAPTSRHGTPDDLRAFVDAFHQAGIGVILDWVPAHFPQDAFALARFDGTALYEHEDPRLGFHQDWGTHIFNFGRNEVKSFLLASAHYWLAEFHLDGIRVDAVASMLYLDYSRAQGEWLPNRYGGRENLEAIEFLRDLNVLVHRDFPGALTFAEESTAWPAVSRPVHLGGLGFSMKWNMGWMNDTLRYLHREPIYRRFHHDELTFGQLYAYTENFILPLSHDEVVHGKGSLIGKMPGDGWQKFANLRLLFAYQMTCPGKKLHFMGNELAQGREWQVLTELDWGQLQVDSHRGVQALLRDLNRLYRDVPALHDLDFSHEGFQWIDCHDADQSIISYLRRARSGSCVAVVLNFTPVPRRGYRIGVPSASAWREIVNTDSRYYGGSDVGNGGDILPTGISWMGQADSIEVTLPPLGCLILAPA